VVSSDRNTDAIYRVSINATDLVTLARGTYGVYGIYAVGIAGTHARRPLDRAGTDRAKLGIREWQLPQWVASA
jgi:hypothetical protein